MEKALEEEVPLAEKVRKLVEEEVRVAMAVRVSVCVEVPEAVAVADRVALDVGVAMVTLLIALFPWSVMIRDWSCGETATFRGRENKALDPTPSI